MLSALLPFPRPLIIYIFHLRERETLDTLPIYPPLGLPSHPPYSPRPRPPPLMPTVQYSDAVGGGGPGERGGSLHRGPSVGRGLRRGKTLSRPERYQQPAPLLPGEQTNTTAWEPWPLFAKLITIWAPPPLLRYLGKTDKGMQQAWREKITLCFLIALLGGAVSFLTVGLSITLCPPSAAANQENYLTYNDLGDSGWCLLLLFS